MYQILSTAFEKYIAFAQAFSANPQGFPFSQMRLDRIGLEQSHLQTLHRSEGPHPWAEELRQSSGQMCLAGTTFNSAQSFGEIYRDSQSAEALAQYGYLLVSPNKGVFVEQIPPTKTAPPGEALPLEPAIPVAIPPHTAATRSVVLRRRDNQNSGHGRQKHQVIDEDMQEASRFDIIAESIANLDAKYDKKFSLYRRRVNSALFINQASMTVIGVLAMAMGVYSLLYQTSSPVSRLAAKFGMTVAESTILGKGKEAVTGNGEAQSGDTGGNKTKSGRNESALASGSAPDSATAAPTPAPAPAPAVPVAVSEAALLVKNEDAKIINCNGTSVVAAIPRITQLMHSAKDPVLKSKLAEIVSACPQVETSGNANGALK